jgi:hypothetical protein
MPGWYLKQTTTAAFCIVCNSSFINDLATWLQNPDIIKAKNKLNKKYVELLLSISICFTPISG